MSATHFDPTLFEQDLRHGHLRHRDGGAERRVEVEGLSLASRFEPLYSRAHGRPVGHRAVLEVVLDGERLGVERATVEIEMRACQERIEALSAGLHMSNYERVAERGWLWLRVAEPVVRHSSLWPPLPQDMFSSSQYAPHHIVLEVPAEAASAEQLADFARYHQELGFAVALADFGRNQADLSGVWSMRPDIVSITPSGLAAAAGERFERMLGALSRVLHESGAMVAVRDIDDEEVLRQVLATDADLLEGDAAHLAQDTERTLIPLAGNLAELRHTVAACSTRIAAGSVFETACEPLLKEPGALRCYLLDDAGVQITDNLARIGVRSDPRFWPLAKALGACWSHRPYVRSAIAHPGQVMATEPYFSLPDGHHCVTLAIAFEAQGETLVLCCDLAEPEQTLAQSSP